MNAPHSHPPITVALCIPDDADTEILTQLEGHSRTVKVVRRCADLVELEAVALAGIARIGVMSAADPDCDRPFIQRLHDAGMTVLLLQEYSSTGDPIGTPHLMELGPDLLIPANEPESIARALLDLVHAKPPQRMPPSLDAHRAENPPHNTDIAPPSPRTVEAPDEATSSTNTSDIFHGQETQRHSVPPQDTHSLSDQPDPLNDPERTHHPSGITEKDGQSPLSISDTAWLNAAKERSRRGTVIAVWGTSGAPGRTTIAVNLAAALHHHHILPPPHVVLIDADTYAPSVAHALGMSTDVSSLSAIARFAARGAVHAEHIEGAQQTCTEGMKIITGLSSPHRWREASPTTLTQCIRAASEYADYVVVDCAAGTLDPLDEFGRFSAGRDEGIVAVLNSADIILVVARSDAEGLHRLMYSLEWLRDHASGALVRIAANMVCEERAGTRPAQAIAQALAPYLPGEDISLIAEDPQVLKAQLRGCSVIAAAPTSPASEAFAQLASLLVRLAAHGENVPNERQARRQHGRHRKGHSSQARAFTQGIRKRRKAQTRDTS